MNIICLVFSIIFIICTVLFLMGKGSIFIPDWEKLSQEEKDDIPLQKLSLNMATVLGSCSLILFAGGLSDSFREHFFVPLMVVWLVATGIDVYFIEKSGKIEKSDREKHN